MILEIQFSMLLLLQRQKLSVENKMENPNFIDEENIPLASQSDEEDYNE